MGHLPTRAGDRVVFFLVATLLTPVCRASANCVPYPLSLRIGNVTLSNHEIARGVELSVGTPPQSLAFLPQWPLNNSFVYGINGFCDSVSPGWSDNGCITFRGGQYNEIQSTTRQEASGNVFAPDSGPYPQLDCITDTFNLSSKAILGNFPLGIALNDWGEQGYLPQMALGFGSNSTLFNTLVGSGQVVARTWGMFWGRTGSSDSSHLDGSLVLGGYDKAKVTGEKFVQSMSVYMASCPSQLMVSITDLILNFPNGTTASLFPAVKSTAISACIEPSFPSLMTLPLNPYFYNFEILTNSSISGRSYGLNFFDSRYDAGYEPYDGDLTIQLSTGFSVRVPNEELIVPDVYINQQTGALIVNSTQPDTVINSIQQINADDLSQLGRNFLTAAYLMVNQDAGLFTLWEANPTTDENLVAVDGDGNEIDTFCAAGSPVGGNSSSPSASQSTPSNTDRPTTAAGRSSMGPIIGGTIGGVAGLAALGVAAFHYWRRRSNMEKGVRSDPGAVEDYDPKPAGLPRYSEPGGGGGGGLYYKAELQGTAAGEVYYLQNEGVNVSRPGEVQYEMPG